jgi:bifunctional non-homologous end joining protein LigD
VTTIERFGPYRVELSNQDKLFFPGEEITKGDLIGYYRDVAQVMLPHLENRPLTLHRFPDGIEGDGFYQQRASDYFPEWLQTLETPRANGDSKPVKHVLCNNRATLVYLANQGVVAFHGWASRSPRLGSPDRLIFDLDPPNEDFDAVRWAAKRIVGLMKDLGMSPFPMTTGSRGLHIVAPLRNDAGFDEVRGLARDMAGLLAQQHSDALTVEQRKNKRHGRIYLDVSRNAYGQTAVMPYSVRALPEAPVATPLSLEELNDGKLGPRRWRIDNIFRRLGQKDDPWKTIRKHAKTYRAVRAALDDLRND